MSRAARAALRFLAFSTLIVIAVALAPVARAGELVISSRVWPAQDYTRVTFESARPIKHSHFFVKDPERLVLDLEGVDLNEELKRLPAKVGAADPYIQAVRIARNRPNVVRVVFDLRTQVKPPSVFSLAPAGEYKHRLVLDIHPRIPPDPLLALLAPKPDPIGEIAHGLPVEPARAASSTEAVPELPVVKLAPDKPPVVAKGPEKARPVKERLVIVAIDAGHGGEDPGARGRLGTREKDVTLAIAKRLKARIEQEPNMRVVMIRDGDYFIPLAERVRKSRRVNADLLVSIHADAWVKPDARGSSVFALSEHGATTAAARWLAQRENASDQIGGVNLDAKDPVLARTLLDLSLTATINDSLKLGKAVLSELGDINTLHKHSVEQAGFAVLKAPDIPSILVETAFISNPDEERKLKDNAYQEKLANAIFSGIKRYLAQNPPLSRSKVAAF